MVWEHFLVGINNSLGVRANAFVRFYSRVHHYVYLHIQGCVRVCVRVCLCRAWT